MEGWKEKSKEECEVFYVHLGEDSLATEICEVTPDEMK